MVGGARRCASIGGRAGQQSLKMGDMSHVFEIGILTDDIKIVKFVLKNGKHGIDINQNLRNVFPLLSATQSKNYDMIKLLLEFGAEVDRQDVAGNSSLMVASNLGHQPIVQLLLQKNANVNLVNELGYTALMFASHNGHSGIVNLLLSAAASSDETNVSDFVDKTNNNGLTALMLAAFQGHTAVVALLCQYSARLGGELVIGVSALEIAKAKGHQGVITALSSVENKPDVSICSGAFQPEELTRVIDILVRDMGSRNSSQAPIDGSLHQTPTTQSYRTMNATFIVFTSVSHMWENIALHLHLADSIIQTIKGRTLSSNLDYLREVLRECFKRQTPTWNDLDRVVSDLFADKPLVVRRLQDVSPNPQSVVKDTVPMEVTGTSAIDRSLTLNNALRITFKLASEWHTLGIFLRINPHDLDKIKSDNDSANDRLRETLKVWLKGCEATWEDLHGAVEYIDHKLAKEIKKKYINFVANS